MFQPSDFCKDGDLVYSFGGRLVPRISFTLRIPYILENVSTPEGVKFVDATEKGLPGGFFLKNGGLFFWGELCNISSWD